MIYVKENLNIIFIISNHLISQPAVILYIKCLKNYYKELIVYGLYISQ